jgi:SsrA-binding protein
MSNIISENRRARREYEVEDTLEVGMILTGSEVKSLRAGRATIAESYARIENGALMLVNANFPEYPGANRFNHIPTRPRRLLAHRRQIHKLAVASDREGRTLVPLKLYWNEKGLAKLLIGVAKGRKAPDKRDLEKSRDWDRQKARLMRDKG